MKSTKILGIVLIGLLLFAGISCSSSKEEKVSLSDDELVLPASEIQTIIQELPKPADLPYILENTGADYNALLTNPTATLPQYEKTTSAAALNLGVYTTDLGYTCVYEKQKEAMEYFKAVVDLANTLGVTGGMDQTIVARFEKNLNNKDSLVALVNSAGDQTNKYLIGNEKDALAALIFAGSYLEGLYISTSLIENYPNPTLTAEQKNLVLINICKLVVDQKTTLIKLIALLRAVPNNSDAQNILENLLDLEKTYQKLDLDEKIKSNRGDLMISDVQLIEIARKVKNIREGITGL